MDHFSKYVFLKPVWILDHFSKYVFLKPVKKIDSSVFIKYLENELFMTFAVPQVLLSDNGSSS